MRKSLFQYLIIFLITASGFVSEEKDILKYVDTTIGTEDGGGATFIGVCTPHGMVKLGPDTPLPQNTSGYIPNAPIVGFSHTHVSGTGGAGKYGNIMVVPQAGKPVIKNYSSEKANEFGTAGYYSVELKRWNIKSELTALHKTGFHRYTSLDENSLTLLIDLSRVVNVVEFSPGVNIHSYIKIIDENNLEGYGTYKGGIGPVVPYTVYFSARTSQPITKFGVWRDETIYKNVNVSYGDSIGAFIKFNSDEVELKVAISFLSLEQAKKNLNEVIQLSFDEAKAKAQSIWSKELNKIQITGGTEEQKTLFYSCLYNTMLMPTDVTGENPRWSSDQPAYWDFIALWDTYRNVNPLYTIIDSEKQVRILKSLLDIYSHTGWIPDNWSSGCFAFMQGGTNSDVLFADAMAKGLKGFDYELAYESMIKHAETPSDSPYEYGKDSDEYLKLGYSSSNKWCGSSRTLEYAFNDFCVSQAANVLNKKSDREKYLKRSLNSYNIFREDEKFFWAKNPDGSWVEGFDPEFRIEEWWEGPYFYEGLPWHYSTFVPHDIGGLIDRHGSKENFVKFLDRMFDEEHYIQHNQPDILTPYLYVYAERHDKTVERVREILEGEYKTTTSGLPGQDDAGCMSAWYVFSAMGFYPNAGQNLYLMSSPIFDEVKIDIGNGKTFTIIAENLSQENIYIKEAKLNGSELYKAWFNHDALLEGGELILTMTNEPTDWGNKNAPLSVSEILKGMEK